MEKAAEDIFPNRSYYMRVMNDVPVKIPMSIQQDPNSFDPVHRPSHYNQHGIECIQAIEASMSPEEFRGYLKGNVIKYTWRYSYKGKAKEDLQKAEWYLKELIKRVN